MSTAAASHHRISDPIATAVAVVVVIVGATVLGIAAFQDDSPTPTAPAAPVHGKIVVKHPSRIGMGDFTQTSPNGGNGGQVTTLKGGHTVPGLP